MRGRVMYVVPYVLGLDSGVESAGVQVTDDLRVVIGLSRSVHVDATVREAPQFVRSLHAVHTPSSPTICCFVEGRTIWAPSVGSRELLDARAHALRLATVEMRDTDRLPARMGVVAVSREGGERPLYVGVVAPHGFGRAPSVLLGTTRERTSYRVLAEEVVWLSTDDGRLHAVLCERAPAGDDAAEIPATVPIDAIVLCTRRAEAGPLVLELPNWGHAAYAATMLAADADDASVDPMGMTAHCGIDINEYIDRWFALGSRLRRPPKTFQLNWFIRGPDGSMLWPALYEGWRVVKWITSRVEGHGSARATFAGGIPSSDSIEREGLRLPDEAWRQLLDADPVAWARELEFHARILARLGKSAPLDLYREHRGFEARLAEAATPRLSSEEQRS
jgi:GTP-dependent phosphoenolpyruvate carboxykinase